MTKFMPLREIPEPHNFGSNDVLVVFGELFSRGYANGIVDEAKKAGMKIIYSTVGRRDKDGQLRALNEAELEEKGTSPLINVPLEAGFDMEPSNSGQTPVDQLKGVKLSDWDKAQMDLKQLEESRHKGIERFRAFTRQYMSLLEAEIPNDANVVFVHTMAGGVPRAKIVMPAMNRVFKGYGDRYASSEEFWKTHMGQFCEANFEEVTGNTLAHLIDLSSGIRDRQEKNGKKVSYVAYGYHGTDVLQDNHYQWQSYSPYLQGFAKLRLENIAQNAWDNGIKASVFNAPEILTNSSSIFLGVEVSLYPLLGALEKEGSNSAVVKKVLNDCMDLMKEGESIQEIMEFTSQYLSSPVIQDWSKFEKWPQHNGPEQMEKMRLASTNLIERHKDTKNLMTFILSEVVFRACGELMLAEAWNPQQPVWWIGHDIIAKQTAQ